MQLDYYPDNGISFVIRTLLNYCNVTYEENLLT